MSTQYRGFSLSMDVEQLMECADDRGYEVEMINSGYVMPAGYHVMKVGKPASLGSWGEYFELITYSESDEVVVRTDDQVHSADEEIIDEFMSDIQEDCWQYPKD